MQSFSLPEPLFAWRSRFFGVVFAALWAALFLPAARADRMYVEGGSSDALAAYGQSAISFRVRSPVTVTDLLFFGLSLGGGDTPWVRLWNADTGTRLGIVNWYPGEAVNGWNSKALVEPVELTPGVNYQLQAVAYWVPEYADDSGFAYDAAVDASSVTFHRDGGWAGWGVLGGPTSPGTGAAPAVANFASSTPPPPSTDTTDADYELVWSDEFELDGAPDPAKWAFESGFVRNQELQWYQPQNAFCADGLLVIEARREQVANPNYRANSTDWRRNRQYANYTSASLITQNLFSWQYGRLEVRARIDTRAGLWPAIWTVGETGEWPSSGEVDVMEYYLKGGVPSILANTAWGTSTRWVAQWDETSRPLSFFLAQDPSWASKFHVWRMDWDETSIRLSVDGMLMNYTGLSQTLNADGSHPFRRPHYLLMNLAVGSNGGDPSGTAFPARYEIDYARVYRRIANGWAKRDDRHGSVESPGWNSQDGDPAYGDTVRSNADPSEEATFAFTGVKARYYGARRSDLGIAEILVNGVPQATVDCYSAEAEFDAMLFESDELVNVAHTLTVRPTGTKNPSSSGTGILLDAFSAQSPQAGTPWQQRWFTRSQIEERPEMSGPESDHDGDGYSALIEAALGSDPTSDASKPPVSLRIDGENGGPVFCYVFDRLIDRDGIDVITEGVADLRDPWGPVSAEEIITPSDLEGYERIEIRLPIAPGQRSFFLRSSVIQR